MEKLVETMRRIKERHCFEYVDNFTGAVVPKELVELAEQVEGEPEGTVVVVVDGVKMNPVAVDATSANAFLSVYDALSDKNKKSFLSINLVWAMDIAWKCIERSRKDSEP